MALKISPQASLDNMVKGEEVSFTVDVTNELGSDTVDSHTYKIYDSSKSDVTTNFSGDSSISDGIITFGIIAYAAGIYTLQFIVTCNEMLPDGTTPKEFYVNLTVTIV